MTKEEIDLRLQLLVALKENMQLRYLLLDRDETRLRAELARCYSEKADQQKHEQA